MKIKFLGAARNVTGSRFLLEANQKRVLIDCGLYQERDYRFRNWEKFPVEPSTIQAVLLTHAHIDHCGYLPKLVKEGFAGKIYCTPASGDIAKVTLEDSVHLQKADARFKLRRHKREGRRGPYRIAPLYLLAGVRKTIARLVTVPYKEEKEIGVGFKATFFDAGHILGSSMLQIKVKDAQGEKTIVFSGDVGRWQIPVLRDPHLFETADYVIMESTYGNRLHQKERLGVKKLEEVINSTVTRGGNIIIPSFAIGRAQELIYALNHLLKEKKIPQIPVIIDSPMAIKITEIFKKYPGCFDQKAKRDLAKYRSLFSFPGLIFSRGTEESKAVVRRKGSSIIIAGSGMCTGGRIKHHLLNNIERKESTILFVGYQAFGTLGRRILERPKKARILGQECQVKARIEKINGFSAHADQKELLKWVSSFKKGLKKVFIVHGEEKAALEFARILKTKQKAAVCVPRYLDEDSL